MNNFEVDRIVAVVTTVGSMADARQLAKAIVEGGLAACVQLDEIASVYSWEGKLCDEPEVRLTAKTLPAMGDELVRFIRARHPYELPQLTWGEQHCSPEYGAWVKAQVASDF